MPGTAEKERKVRDLRSQIAELEPGRMDGVVFEHIRTGRELVTIYSMTDGEPIPIPQYMVGAALMKTTDGRYMFTDNPDEAPEYRQGKVKCFMHAESSERASGVLDEIGLAGKVCPAGKLGSVHSKRIHGERRHGREWAAYQEYLDNEKEAKAVARQEQQLEATLALAGKAARPDVVETPEFRDAVETPTVAAPGECDICGKTGFKNVGAHKRGAHNERA